MILTPLVQIAILPGAGQAIPRRIRQALRPDTIFLFGSQARGDAEPDSA
jgi:predicted nucleotidyltransferase